MPRDVETCKVIVSWYDSRPGKSAKTRRTTMKVSQSGSTSTFDDAERIARKRVAKRNSNAMVTSAEVIQCGRPGGKRPGFGKPRRRRRR